MADIYTKSGAANSSPFASWANAATTLAGASGIDATDDTIYVSQSHSESSATAQTIALANGVKVLCANDAAEPPTADAAGAIVQTTVASTINITGTGNTVKGIAFKAGSGNNQANISYATQDGFIEFDSCSFELPNTSTNSRISFGGSTPTRVAVRLKNCGLKFGSTSQFSSPTYANILIEGGSLLPGGSSPASLFVPVNSDLDVSRFDLTNAATTINMAGTISSPCAMKYRNILFPSGWTGNLGSHTVHGARSEMHDYKIGATSYQLWVSGYAGDIKENRTVVRTGGANDGADYSWRMVSSANSRYPSITLGTPEFSKYNTSTSAITATVEIVRDSATALTDAEIWLEVSYTGASGQTVVTDAKASIIATAADQESSTTDWTTTGLSTPLKQKLSVTFTPASAGWLQAKVKLAKASTTVYVDPMLTVA